MGLLAEKSGHRGLGNLFLLSLITAGYLGAILYTSSPGAEMPPEWSSSIAAAILVWCLAHFVPLFVRHDRHHLAPLGDLYGSFLALLVIGPLAFSFSEWGSVDAPIWRWVLIVFMVVAALLAVVALTTPFKNRYKWAVLTSVTAFAIFWGVNSAGEPWSSVWAAHVGGIVVGVLLLCSTLISSSWWTRHVLSRI